MQRLLTSTNYPLEVQFKHTISSQCIVFETVCGNGKLVYQFLF